MASTHTPPAVASACVHVHAAASRNGQRAAGASKRAARGSATTGAAQQQQGARSGSLTRSWRTGHCCALPARAAAQPQPCPHPRGSRHRQIMSAVPACRRRRARTRGSERVHERACGSAGTAWERSHLSASGLALRLLIEVVGDGVLRWLFAAMNLAGALTSGIARPSRACTVRNRCRERDGPQEGAQTRSCAGGLVRPKLVASAAWGAVSSALARLLPSPCHSPVCRALSPWRLSERFFATAHSFFSLFVLGFTQVCAGTSCCKISVKEDPVRFQTPAQKRPRGSLVLAPAVLFTRQR